MADEKQLKLLNKGVAGWNEWRKENAGEKIDLIKAYLAGADLSEANLSEADLRGANLTGAILCEADLHRTVLIDAVLNHASLKGANLRGADVRSVNLWQANLSNANLVGARFTGADLTDAQLSKADLGRVEFGGADLTRAQLSKANLGGADFAEANLSRADLTGVNLSAAVFYETILGNTDLTDATGLETCEHRGPSTLDHRTLERSGELPLVFLRGCGLPEMLIDYLPSLLGKAIEFYSCFISYSHDDKTFARRLHDQLQGKGIRCWLDEHQLKPGDDIYEGVDRGIRLWDKVLLCCSEASLSSWWVEREVDTAIEKEKQLRKKHGHQKLAIIPLNLDGHMFDWTGKHAATLRSRLAPDFTGWEQDNAKFESQFESVVAALRSDEQSREKPPEPKL